MVHSKDQNTHFTSKVRTFGLVVTTSNCCLRLVKTCFKVKVRTGFRVRVKPL